MKTYLYLYNKFYEGLTLNVCFKTKREAAI